MNKRKQFNNYDPRSWLERSALLFLKHGQHSASIECFQRLTSMEPGYSMAWYGLSTAIYSASGATRSLELLKQSISVLKHCLTLDATNDYAKNFLSVIPNQTPLNNADLEQIRPATTFDLPSELQFTITTFADCLHNIPDAGERMQLVMWVGTFEHESSFELLVTALSDSDPGVVRATLKRLPAIQDRRILDMLSEMYDSGAHENYEPYFSMASKRLDLPFANTSLWD